METGRYTERLETRSYDSWYFYHQALYRKHMYTTVYCMWNVLVTLTKQVLYSIVLIVVDYLRKEQMFTLTSDYCNH